MITNNKMLLDSSFPIHSVYRALLNSGRTYAAFKEKPILSLLSQFDGHKEIFDPMAGYGCLMTYCSQSPSKFRSFNIECNPPSHYWQYLMHPKNFDVIIALCERVLGARKGWPQSRVDMCISDTWFPRESFIILEKLWSFCLEIATNLSNEPEKIAVSFLLPFVGRFSSYVQGNVVTHIKPGGICVHTGWKDDFATYTTVVLDRLKNKRDLCKQFKHHIVLGDARTYKFRNKQFSAMITSPPYPNGRDYSKMFALENAFIDWLVSRKYISDVSLKTRLIGSPIVSESNGYVKKTPEDIQSKPAKEFLYFLQDYKENKRAENDNRVYYVPYYSNYFYGLEQAYRNISTCLEKPFKGYIVVVNNTARKKVIPVAETVVDIWQKLNYDAQIDHTRTQEFAHVGGLNPRVKGINARHVEYTIRITR